MSNEISTDPLTWTAVCTTDQLPPERGIAALVDGRAVALFRTFDDQWFALDNHCPYARASVLARGIVGTKRVEGPDGSPVEVPFVASPMLKQRFGLRDGICLDAPEVRVPTFAVRILGGVVHIGVDSRARDAQDAQDAT